MRCGICLDEIYLPYFKNNKCKCKIYYHLKCIQKWHSLKKGCIICKKDISSFKNIIKIHNRIYNCLFIFILCIINLFFWWKVVTQRDSVSHSTTSKVSPPLSMVYFFFL